MYKEIVLIEEVIGLQKTYSILDLELTNLIDDIIRMCREHRFNILDMKVLFHSLRVVPFKNEDKALMLCNELLKHIKRKSFSSFLKKLKQLQHLIQGNYTINGSMTMYKDNNIRWETTVSYVLNQTIMNILK